MRTRRRAWFWAAVVLLAVMAVLLLSRGGTERQEMRLASIAPALPVSRVPDAAPAPGPPPRPVAAAPKAPIFDLVRMEKEEVCEGEENLVTVRAHTPDGNDAFLHYTIAGEAGAQVPLRAFIGRDGRPMPQYAVAFSRDNVATRIELPPYRVKSCRPDRILTVTMRMLPNSSAAREFTAVVRAGAGGQFTAAWYEWSFGDGTFETTAGPVAVHDYSRLPQRTAFTDLLVRAKAVDGGGQAVEGRYALQIRNVAFHTRQRGVATLFSEPSPRFPLAGPDGVVRQKFRLWHAEDSSVRITGATRSRRFLPANPGSPPPPQSEVAVDPGPFLAEIAPGEERVQSLEYDFGADPGVHAVTYGIQGITATGMQARGELTLLRPPPKPTRENSVPVQDPAMILKIRRAMAILKQETVSQEDIWRLEREGMLP